MLAQRVNAELIDMKSKAPYFLSMKVLVIGQGGREHALIRALSLSPTVSEIHCIPGSDGIARESICHSIDLKDFEKTGSFIKKNGIELVIFGPEQPLADGLSDYIRNLNIPVFGPNQQSAQFESSKAFCKNFLNKHKIPTAKSFKVTTVEETLIAAKNFKPPFVLKADGLAAGKGVVICETEAELKSHAESFFIKKSLGPASESALLEEFMKGWELSYLILTNGEDYAPLPLAQDHKRLLEKDRGPNTGGMGTVAPLLIDENLHTQIKNKILRPIVEGIKKDNMNYRGVLFIGLMITPEGPKVLEFNVRFGDPEAQVLLPLLDGDWARVFLEIANGKVPQLKWKKNIHLACVVLAAEGYPESPVKNVVINGNPTRQTASSYFLHAGTKAAGDGWTTNGGRVLNAIGIGSNREEALKHAYALVEYGKWNGMQFRRDIGEKAPF